MPLLTTGKAAEEAGVGRETLRFYEREGLIEKPIRGNSGYRQYPPETIARVRFIRRAKELGFTLNEIRDLLALSDPPNAECAQFRAHAKSKIEEIRSKIGKLRKVERALSSLVDTCERSGTPQKCPILDALED
ncbi:MAG: heavy metal-responsive transcriptional regulator [Puniceicoccaceae bacterium]|nr:heavy metal-responsive transcriptional regulator [Puniceicoccaceae bacterium]|tara:strand:+ start:1355 stop:1753 length:399 start_codon:yes stop_codon:yes gene_type:complete